jgi:hypothetical protein
MDIKGELRKRLNENKETPKTFDDFVNMKQLEAFAVGLSNICMGEYGDTYINKEEKKIGIVLGDSNPFKEEYLKDWIENMCFESWGDDKVEIEIDCEWQPSGDNWVRFDGEKWEI